MRPECINVRARSANEGSGTADGLLVAPLACFPKDEEDIVEHPLGIRIILNLQSRGDGGSRSASVVSLSSEVRYEVQQFSFGQIRIDGVEYGYDVVIDRGKVGKRKKKASEKFREAFGHTPLSLEEEIPWKCSRLVVGTGTGALLVMEEVKAEAQCRKIELLILPTAEAIEERKRRPNGSNTILHLTC